MMTARQLRIISLIAPMFLGLAASPDNSASLFKGAMAGLCALWVALAIVLLIRLWLSHRAQQAAANAAGTPVGEQILRAPWGEVDLLTASGAVSLWTAAGALILALFSGWASLAVIGVMGMGVVLMSTFWTAIVTIDLGRWRRAKLERTIVPATSTEGDELREEINISGLSIPPGMRMFVLGRTHRHGPVSRYVVEGHDSGAEIKLESNLGPAQRGEHRAEALALWFTDVFGLSRSPAVHRGETTFNVMPRPAAVDGAQALLGGGGDAAVSKPTRQAPTEGTFRIREYVPGDDARRIHWVRSLQQGGLDNGELVVRLPDEVPPAEPAIRLVLDNELAGADSLTCRATDELLDALVRIWLGIAKSLAANGTRVTLVAAVPKNGRMTRIERRMDARTIKPALQLGAAVGWQAGLTLDDLVGTGRKERAVVVSARPRRVSQSVSEARWVVVPEVAWTTIDCETPSEHGMKHAFPVGSPENRESRRSMQKLAAMTRWQDRSFFSQVVCWTDWSRFAGDHVARPGREPGRVTVEVIP
jgi:uncharacterized protein (DUF58 family)